jgi:hypothetical protein
MAKAGAAAILPHRWRLASRSGQTPRPGSYKSSRTLGSTASSIGLTLPERMGGKPACCRRGTQGGFVASYAQTAASSRGENRREELERLARDNVSGATEDERSEDVLVIDAAQRGVLEVDLDLIERLKPE